MSTGRDPYVCDAIRNAVALGQYTPASAAHGGTDKWLRYKYLPWYGKAALWVAIWIVWLVRALTGVMVLGTVLLVIGGAVAVIVNDVNLSEYVSPVEPILGVANLLLFLGSHRAYRRLDDLYGIG